MAWRMFQAASRSSTGTSDSVNSAWATGPVHNARAASPAALRYCAVPNFARSPRPITSTRGAVTPGKSCSSAVLPVLPLTSPRAMSALSLPPLAASMACAAGARLWSANAPTITQSVATSVGAEEMRLNSRDIAPYRGIWVEFRTIAAQRERTRDSRATRPDAEAGPLPHAGIHPIPVRHARRARHHQPRRRVRGPAGRDRPRQGARRPAAVAVGPAPDQLPADPAPAGADAGPAAGARPHVPRFGDARAGLHRRGPPASAAAGAVGDDPGRGGGRHVRAVARPGGAEAGQRDGVG